MADEQASGGRDRRPPSPAVDRALTVLETLVSASEPLTLTSLAKQTRIPLATCAAIVYTLEERGYASRRIVGRSHFWRPTLRLYGLATQLVRKIDLSDLAQPHLRALADTLGMPAHVGVLNGRTVVYVAKAAPPGFIQFDTYPGKVAPFNLTALGRAIAAYLPDVDLVPLLTQLAVGTGPKAPPPTAKALRTELEVVRAQGFAVEDEEETAEIACVAAPFFDAEGLVAGSVGVTGFSREVTGDRLTAVVEAVRAQAAELSRHLGHSPA
ncbi:IclR family transcriptional regulator [Fodinicola feengrottensis]|uniref:IclR family transcriptional regulator n=1 Tax=Fodinicola feengrottensis TaxID=435914 RepID=UPI0013D7C3E5|nr:IclR family transcriptional regulator [Fodinicola feengrottensis]